VILSEISYVSREVIDEAMQCSMLTIKKLGSGFYNLSTTALSKFIYTKFLSQCIRTCWIRKGKKKDENGSV